MTLKKAQLLTANKYRFNSWREAILNSESEFCEVLFGEALMLYSLSVGKEGLEKKNGKGFSTKAF